MGHAKAGSPKELMLGVPQEMLLQTLVTPSWQGPTPSPVRTVPQAEAESKTS